MKLTRFDLVYSKSHHQWEIRGMGAWDRKADALAYAISACKKYPGGATLRIHTKGTKKKPTRIAQERTYPRSRDPRRRKG